MNFLSKTFRKRTDRSVETSETIESEGVKESVKESIEAELDTTAASTEDVLEKNEDTKELNSPEEVQEQGKDKQKLVSNVRAFAQHTKQQGNAKVSEALNFAKGVGSSTQQHTQKLTSSGFRTIQQVQQTIAGKTQQGVTNASQTLDDWQKAIAALGASGMVTANALKDLPRNALELAQEMPKVARRMKTAGIRTDAGEPLRSTDADIMGLFNKIPGTSKLEANEFNIRTFLSGKDGSHIRSRAEGGGSGANNIVWEIHEANKARGAATMTGGEQLYIRFYNAAESILENSKTIANLGIKATGTAILTQALVVALSYTLDLYRGDITAKEFRDKIIEAAAMAGIATPIFFLIFVAVMALFPEVVVILSAPAVVSGFNALFGVGIALPIIQSIIRHVDASGFGEETKTLYEETIARGDALLESSFQEVQKWWQYFFSSTFKRQASSNDHEGVNFNTAPEQ